MRELVKITLFSAILALISYVLNYMQVDFLHAWIYHIIGFLWMVYTVIHFTYFLLRERLAIDSPLMPLVGLGLRMLITLFTIMLAMLSGLQDVVLFVINFMVIYFLYLGFEIIALLSNLRRNSSSDQN